MKVYVVSCPDTGAVWVFSTDIEAKKFIQLWREEDIRNGDNPDNCPMDWVEETVETSAEDVFNSGR